jgi:hydroxymethylpyrimidine/phosphomethylpyrimidine kinase
MRPVILSIAGYDPSSGAGITADIKTAAAHGCYAVTCITALTVQSTQGVFEVRPLEGGLVARTLDVLADDLPIAAVRVGMLGSASVAAAVADFLQLSRLPNVILDPVIRSSSGTPLLDPGGVEILKTRLIPLVDVLTPNISEAAQLADTNPLPQGAVWDSSLPNIQELAAKLHRLGARAVVITGGHLGTANDYLSYEQGARSAVIEGKRLESRSTHGTGCAYATSLACRLAAGDSLPDAARAAKGFVQQAIQSAYPLGKGVGPLNHLG